MQRMLCGVLFGVFSAVSFAACLDEARDDAPATVIAPSHAWANYHWARTANPFTVKLGDNVSSAWDGFLAAASTDWTASSVLDTTVVPGRTKPRVCKATGGQVEVCNDRYGFNGWLGIASIWASGDHITQGTVKLNDSYFNSASYNTPAWRQFVVCQEVGHTFGLDHQDENFDNPNLGTCMDYTSDPSTNLHPNAHDYEELETIYAHLDTYNSYVSSGGGGGGGGACNAPPGKGCNKADVPGDPQGNAWGRSLGRKGQREKFLRVDSDGTRHVTFVIWAVGN